jgi:hypothetical protein
LGDREIGRLGDREIGRLEVGIYIPGEKRKAAEGNKRILKIFLQFNFFSWTILF